MNISTEADVIFSVLGKRLQAAHYPRRRSSPFLARPGMWDTRQRRPLGTSRDEPVQPVNRWFNNLIDFLNTVGPKPISVPPRNQQQKPEDEHRNQRHPNVEQNLFEPWRTPSLPIAQLRAIGHGDLIQMLQVPCEFVCR